MHGGAKIRRQTNLVLKLAENVNPANEVTLKKMYNADVFVFASGEAFCMSRTSLESSFLGNFMIVLTKFSLISRDVKWAYYVQGVRKIFD